MSYYITVLRKNVEKNENIPSAEISIVRQFIDIYCPSPTSTLGHASEIISQLTSNTFNYSIHGSFIQ